MECIDPTYLRTIYDQLYSGALHKDNASGLPHGLTGLYESVLPPSLDMKSRERILDFFTPWALLQKEASAELAATLIEGAIAAEVLKRIGEYSKWFNSPESSKYLLYHERLQAFVLQRIPQGELLACNERIVACCQAALDARDGSEWEYYALEHLSTHLLLPAMLHRDATALKTFAYNKSLWSRQLDVSKGYKWSEKTLKDMSFWASSFSEDEVIACALHQVELHHQEQDAAPRILELVKQNDMATALERIESFGGDDPEGVKRKCLLYLLCLGELFTMQCFEEWQAAPISEICSKLSTLPFERIWFDDVHDEIEEEFGVIEALKFSGFVLHSHDAGYMGTWLRRVALLTKSKKVISRVVAVIGRQLQTSVIAASSVVRREGLLAHISELTKSGHLLHALKLTNSLEQQKSSTSVRRAFSELENPRSVRHLGKFAFFDFRSECLYRIVINSKLKGLGIAELLSTVEGQIQPIFLLRSVSMNVAKRDLLKARNILGYAMKLALEIQKGESGWRGERELAFKAISSGFAEIGFFDEAIRVWREIEIPNQLHPGVEEMIVDELVKKGSFDQAISFLELIHEEDVGDKYRVLGRLARAYMINGNIENALEIAKQIADSEGKKVEFWSEADGDVLSRDIILRKGICALARKDPSISLDQVIDAIVCDREKSGALAELSNIFAQAGDAATSSGLHNRSLEIADQIADIEERDLSLKILSTELVRQSSIDEAVGIIEMIAENAERDFANFECAEILVLSQRWREAESFLNRISGLQWQDEGYRKMGIAMMSSLGFEPAVYMINQLTSSSKVKLMKEAMFESMDIHVVNDDLIKNALRIINVPGSLLEKILHNYALHRLFFSDADKEEIERYDSVFDIRWAIDIKSSISAN